MLKRLIAFSALSLSLAAPVLAQTSGPPALPRTATTTPDANSGASTVTTLPGVTDPTTTNSTTGTVDQEDHCQPPGTPSNTNPSAQTPTLPRPEQACN
ncbi:hypothetical protein [Neorhizobium vignae]|uniref:hypothetical protein n=1 Tax=Neorhizobium vignae TaxID=690585 RepID=UPI0005698CBB|nr:hypothetical protein [Neorhizobium vignae]